jgi:hypothetical protein
MPSTENLLVCLTPRGAVVANATSARADAGLRKRSTRTYGHYAATDGQVNSAGCP